MRIAILGTRGVPANYGGFETFADELSARLAARGHDVTVVGRHRWVGGSRRLANGVRTRNVATLAGKYTETVSAAFLSSLLPGLPKHVVLCNTACFVALPVLRLRGIKVVVNVDGRDAQRRKWGKAGQLWYRIGERVTTRLATAIVADAAVISAHFEVVARQRVEVITYGADVECDPDPDFFESLDLEPDNYVLYVSRFEPENNPDLVAAAYARSQCPMPLVMLGDAAYDRRLAVRVRKLAASDARIRLLGSIYGEGYRQLQRGASVYIQATEVGGTHPALIEAMAARNAILCLSTPENHEVLGDTGLFFDGEKALTSLLDALPHLGLKEMGEESFERVQSHYSWDQVTRAYEDLLSSL